MKAVQDSKQSGYSIYIKPTDRPALTHPLIGLYSLFMFLREFSHGKKVLRMRVSRLLMAFRMANATRHSVTTVKTRYFLYIYSSNHEFGCPLVQTLKME